MNKELIERLAKEAGIHDFYGMAWGQHFDKFAALVAEECAKIAENTYEGSDCSGGDGDSCYSFHGENSATAIRAKFSPTP